MNKILRNNLKKFSAVSEMQNFQNYLKNNQNFCSTENIPQELLFSRTFDRTKLKNGIDITTLKS